MRIVALCLMLFTLGCASDRSDCLPARPTPPPACPDGTFADASVLDPTCVANGYPVCRDPTELCLVCTGSDFPDGCRVPGTSDECVHRCSNC